MNKIENKDRERSDENLKWDNVRGLRSVGGTEAAKGPC